MNSDQNNSGTSGPSPAPSQTPEKPHYRVAPRVQSPPERGTTPPVGVMSAAVTPVTTPAAGASQAGKPAKSNEENLLPSTKTGINTQLTRSKDFRWMRWGLYALLTVASVSFLGVFLWIVVCAWQDKTQESIIAFGKLPPSATALIGAIVAALVAVPLSLCIALAKLVSDESESKKDGDISSVTSVVFELGKALAEGWKSITKSK